MESRNSENLKPFVYFALFVVNQNARQTETVLARLLTRKPEAPDKEAQRT
jgi:hypothetical protein